MLYAAVTFWLLVVVLAAWGAHCQLTAVVRPKALNIVLLPGTLVAQLGHVLSLLITGATVNRTTLFKTDDAWAPETTPDPHPRIPLIGPVLIGFLPLATCSTAILLAACYLGEPFLRRLPAELLARPLPTTLDGFWDLLRDQVTLVEWFVNSVVAADWSSWQTWLFLYLLTCLTIRMAPVLGPLRGSLIATVVLGIAAAGVASLVSVADPRVRTGWSILVLTVAGATSMLLASLFVRGAAGLAKVLTGRG